jgi:hypothetical protein
VIEHARRDLARIPPAGSGDLFTRGYLSPARHFANLQPGLAAYVALRLNQ